MDGFLDIYKKKNSQIFGCPSEKVSKNTVYMENTFFIYISNSIPAAVKTMVIIAVVRTTLQVIQENEPAIALIVLFIHVASSLLKKKPFQGFDTKVSPKVLRPTVHPSHNFILHVESLSMNY